MTDTSLGPALQVDAGYSTYEFVAMDGTVLYVGYTAVGSERIAQHAKRPWWVATDHIQLAHYPTEQEARAAETVLISNLRPLFNVSGRPVGSPAILCSIRELVRQVTERDAENAQLRSALSALRSEMCGTQS